jgi:hypothetical protein
MTASDGDFFLDCARWQEMLDREAGFAAGACVGVLRRGEYAARLGTLLLWKWQGSAMRASTCAYAGTLDPEVAVLLVADNSFAAIAQAEGLSSLRVLIRQGRLHPYILKTMDELEAGGLEDFIEDLWLTAPHH